MEASPDTLYQTTVTYVITPMLVQSCDSITPSPSR